MAPYARTINSIQALAVAKGVNYFANQRHRKFPGISVNTLTSPNFFYDNWIGSDQLMGVGQLESNKYRPLVGIPGLGVPMTPVYGVNVGSMPITSVSVGSNAITITMPATNFIVSGSGSSVSADRVPVVLEDYFTFVETVTPDPWDGIWIVNSTPNIANLDAVTFTAIPVNKTYSQTNLGTFSYELNIYPLLPTTVTKTSQLISTFDMDYKVTSTSIGDFGHLGLALGMITANPRGAYVLNQSDADGTYVELNIPIGVNSGRSRLVTYDVYKSKLRSYSGVGTDTPGRFQNTFKATVKYPTVAGDTDSYVTVGFARTHNSSAGDIVSNDMEIRTTALDNTLCFLASRMLPNNNWWISVTSQGPNQNATYEQRIDTGFSSGVKRNLRIDSTSYGVVRFYVDDNLIYTESSGKIIEPAYPNYEPAVYNSNLVCERMFVGAEVRSTGGTVTANKKFINIYSMQYTNNQAYLKTGISLLKKLK